MWTNEIDDADRVCMKQEPWTCWSRRTRIGLELDAASKCDDVMETKSMKCCMVRQLFVLMHTGTYTWSTRRERGRELRVPYRLRVMNIWTTRRCAGKHNEIERTEIERIMYNEDSMFFTESKFYLYTKWNIRPPHTATQSYTAQHVTKKGKEQRKS